MISVITPLFNKERYIKATLASVQSQDYEDYEHIVVDDASTDRSFEIAEEVARTDKRIVVIRNDENLGKSASRNRALKHARYKWIAPLDGDDIWAASYLRTMLAAIESNPPAIGAFSNVLMRDDSGSGNYATESAVGLYGFDEIVMGRLPIRSGSSVVVSKQCLQRVYGWDETLNTLENHDLWLRIGRLGKLVCSVEPLVTFIRPPRRWNGRDHRMRFLTTLELILLRYIRFVNPAQQPQVYRNILLTSLSLSGSGGQPSGERLAEAIGEMVAGQTTVSEAIRGLREDA